MEHLLNDITAALLFLADKEVKFQIKINNEVISFYGVRLYKNIGAAKAQITKRCEDILREASYYSTITWDFHKNITDEIKQVFKNIDESDLKTVDNNYNDNHQIKKDAKSMSNALIESGIVVIEEV